MYFAVDFLVKIKTICTLDKTIPKKKDFCRANFRPCQLIICFRYKKVYLPVAEFLNSEFPFLFLCTGASLHTLFTLKLPQPT